MEPPAGGGSELPKRAAPVEWSPTLSERRLSPYEYLQFVQRKGASDNAAVSQGIMTRFQSFHLYWKTPTEQQLADYDIALARSGVALALSGALARDTIRPRARVERSPLDRLAIRRSRPCAWTTWSRCARRCATGGG